MDGVALTGAQLLPVLERLVRLLRQTDTSDGLSSAATAVLSRLAGHSAQRLTDLARSERASQPGMTQLVSRMERDGLVRRIRDPHDRRGVLVELTAFGEEVLQRVETEYSAALDVLLGQLPLGDREAIARALPGLAGLVEAADTVSNPAPPIATPVSAGASISATERA